LTISKKKIKNIIKATKGRSTLYGGRRPGAGRGNPPKGGE